MFTCKQSWSRGIKLRVGIKQLIEKKPLADTFIKKILTNSYFMIFITLMGGLFFIFNLTFTSIYFYIIIIMISLLFCRDFTPTTLPFCLLSMSLLKLYGARFADFYSAIPLAVIFAIVFASHFFIYKTKFTRGEFLFPTVLVAISLTVGGLGSITAKEYFEPVAFYYMFTLGFGMVMIYLILTNYIGYDDEIDPKIVLVKAMLCVGLMAFIMMMSAIIHALKINEMYNIQWGNNLSAFLLLSMPFYFYKSTKSKYGTLYFLGGILCCLLLIGTFSRGGILFGLISLGLCVIATLLCCNRKNKIIYLIICCVFAITALSILFATDANSYIITIMNIDKNEARVNLFKVAIANFIKNPIFGSGIGYYGEYYHPQKGAMYWYHSTPFQIIGSLGLVGVLAYLYQFYARVKLLYNKKGIYTLFLFLSFISFEMMGLVNPYDFAPIPYVLLLTEIFIISQYNSKYIDTDDDLLPFLKSKKIN